MVAFRRGEKLHLLNAKHKEPRKQKLICDVEVKGLANDDRVDQGGEGEEHNYPSEGVAGGGLDAEKSAYSRYEDEYSERRCENSEKIEIKQAMPRLNDGGNSRQYVDEADHAPYLFVLTFCHLYSSFRLNIGFIDMRRKLGVSVKTADKLYGSCTYRLRRRGVIRIKASRRRDYRAHIEIG